MRKIVINIVVLVGMVAGYLAPVSNSFAQSSNNRALPAITGLLILESESEPERNACVVTCQKDLLIHIARDFLSIADPEERPESIARAFARAPSCESQCDGQTEVDNSSMCEIDCLDTGLSAIAQCPELSPGDITDPATFNERVIRGRCLFDAADQFLNCQGDCNS